MSRTVTHCHDRGEERRGDKRREDQDHTATARSKPRAVEPAGFRRFYELHPHKKKRPKALKAWLAHGCEAKADEI